MDEFDRIMEEMIGEEVRNPVSARKLSAKPGQQHFPTQETGETEDEFRRRAANRAAK